MALCASTVMPIAAAATSLGASAPPSVAAGLAVGTFATLAIATAVKWALPWFAHDMATVTASKSLPSTNPSVVPGPPKPGSTLATLEPRRSHDHVKPVAAVPTGIALAGYEPTVLSTNQDAVRLALAVRSIAVPAPGNRVDFIKWSDKYWETLIAKVFDLHIPEDVSAQDALVADWIRESGSSPAVKARVATAWGSFRADGYHMHTPLPHSLAWEFSKRDASVKNETILKDASAKPRQILACRPEYVAILAPFIKQLTGVVRRRLVGPPLVYAPGMSEEELSRLVSARNWDNRANGDFDSYDSNQGPDMGASEIKKMSRYGLTVAGRQLVRASLEAHGSSREGVKYSADYCRESGDPRTTLMNTIWNLLAMSYVFCRARDVHPRDMDVLFLAGGDDSQLNYNGPRIDFETALAALGLPATVRHVEHLNQVEFLSCRLTRTSRGWRFIPMVGKMAAKLAFSVHATVDNAAAVLRGAALSIQAAFASSPPGRALVDTYLRVTSGSGVVEPRPEHWKMVRSHTGDTTPETWDDLFAQYGWTPELQEALERDLACVRTHAVTIHSSALQVLVDTDSSRKDCLYPKPIDSDRLESAIAPSCPIDLTTQGIEPNPGPTRVILANSARPRRRRRQGVTIVQQQRARRTVVVQGRRRGNRRARSRLIMARQMGGLAMGGDEKAYMCCLNDPFNCPPVRLGAGCSQPTGLATLYTSGVIVTTSASSIVVWPRVFDTVLVSSTSGPPYTYTVAGVVFQQTADLQARANGARVVAMGVRLTSIASATNDAGLVVAGLLPRDDIVPGSSTTDNTVNGLPIDATTTATQGVTTFLNFEQTESFALRKGVSVFWRPLDPVDFTFRNWGTIDTLGTGELPENFCGNPVVIGIQNATTSAPTLLEVVLHLEYTQGPFVSSVANMGRGRMSTPFVEAAADNVFGISTNTVKEGISGGFRAIGGAIAGGVGRVVGAAIGGAAGNIVDRLGNYFSSTDAQGGTALIPSRRGRRVNMMEVD
jgi:hypothetical protein